MGTETAIVLPPIPKGSKKGQAVLTPDQVREIYRRVTEKRQTHRTVAKDFGVSFATVSEIMLGHAWVDLGLKPIRSERYERREKWLPLITEARKAGLKVREIIALHGIPESVAFKLAREADLLIESSSC